MMKVARPVVLQGLLPEETKPRNRGIAQQRKLKLQGTFDAIRSVMEPARDQFNTWLSDLKDLQKYLANDLIITGIDTAKPLIAKTKSTGLDVQKSLDTAIAELNTIVEHHRGRRHPRQS